MGLITAITAQKKNKKRANIFIDDEYYCSLDKMAVLTFSLKVGTEISAQKLAEITLDSESRSAFDSAIKLLTARMKSQKEIDKYLRDKGYDERAITATIAKLKEYNYLSDEQYARAYINTYRTKFGNKKLAYELFLRGIDDEIVQRLLAQEGGEELEAAEQAAQKYVRTHRSPIVYTKLANYLYSKGFDGQIAKEIAKKYANSNQDEQID